MTKQSILEAIQHRTMEVSFLALGTSQGPKLVKIPLLSALSEDWQLLISIVQKKCHSEI